MFTEGSSEIPSPRAFIFRTGKEGRKKESGQDPRQVKDVNLTSVVRRRLGVAVCCRPPEQQPDLLMPGRSHSDQRQDMDSMDPGSLF